MSGQALLEPQEHTKAGLHDAGLGHLLMAEQG
jgi:hypothetical protein